MFRIKNVRNSTVAKQTNIQHPNNYPITNQIKPPQPKLQPTKVTETVKVRQPSRLKLSKKNEKPKLIIPEVQRKMVANSNISKIANETIYKKQKQETINKGNKIEDKMQMCTNLIQNPIKLALIDDHENKEIPTTIKETKVISLQQQVRLIQSKQKIQIKQQKQKIQKEEQNHQIQKIRRQKKQLQRKNIQTEERRKNEEEQNIKNQAKLKEMMQKVNARRKARQQQKQNRLRLQMERQNHQVGGIMALSDPLAHVQMSQAVMDAQVNRILSMKFANYPNKQAIERQVDELQRINTSYLLVRTDPTNTLNRGLSNFRIELFNRVGQLIMNAQASLGPSASGLQVIQSDSRNYPQIKGMHVTRGLQGHLDMLKKIVLKQVQECAICLCQIQKGKSIYDVECGHKFHEKCLQDWLNTNANCPACRYNIKYNHY